MSRKPTGIAGTFIARVGWGGRLVSNVEKIEWSTNQKEIERKILAFFIREMAKTGGQILEVTDGGITDLDFLLTLPGGKAYLELMEAVVPRINDLPYRPGTQNHDCIDYAEIIFSKVQKKIEKYGANHQIPVQLLIYVTHEQYAANPSGIFALRRFFQERPHSFEYVFFLTPDRGGCSNA